MTYLYFIPSKFRDYVKRELKLQTPLCVGMVMCLVSPCYFVFHEKQVGKLCHTKRFFFIEYYELGYNVVYLLKHKELRLESASSNMGCNQMPLRNATRPQGH